MTPLTLGDSQVVRRDPRAREALAELTAEATVSYRHVVHRPVPPEALARLLPAGVRLATARLVEVRPQRAVGFTHRVVYDAPAMAARREELHSDVLDATTGDRLDGLSEAFWQLPTIPCDRPDVAPDVEVLHGVALGLVDTRTTGIGEELERELGEALEGHLDRLQAYHRERVDEALRADREPLRTRARWIEGRLAETKLPGARLKLVAELGEVRDRLESVDPDRTAVRRLASDHAEREAVERDRHELTLTTALAGVCHLTYDRVVYALELLPAGPLPAAPGPTGQAGPHFPRTGVREVELVPVTGERRFAPCPGCGEDRAPVGIDDQGGAPCARCHAPCAACGVTHRASPAPAACAACGCPPCPSRSGPCPRCGLDPEALRPPEARCVRCGLPTADDPATAGEGAAARRTAPLAGGLCLACGAPCALCDRPVDPARVRPNPRGKGVVCQDHLVPCATCVAPVLAEDAFRCPSCDGDQCAQEVDACPECGLPACRRCARVLAGSCLACAQLRPVEPGSALLRPVFAAFPQLAGVRRWEAVEVGDHLVARWTGRLRRGHVVLDAGRRPVDAHWRWRLGR